MAGLAIRGADEIAAAVDEARILEARRNAGRISQLIIAQRDAVPAREIGRPGAKDVPADEPESSDGKKRDRRDEGTKKGPHAAFLGASCLRSTGRLRNRTPA